MLLVYSGNSVWVLGRVKYKMRESTFEATEKKGGGRFDNFKMVWQKRSHIVDAIYTWFLSDYVTQMMSSSLFSGHQVYLKRQR